MSPLVQKLLRRLEPRPRPVLGGQHHLLLADTRRHLVGQHAHHQRVHIVSRRRRAIPVRMPEALKVRPARDHVEQVPLPSVTPLIRRQPIEHRLVRRLLQIEIERGVDLQPRLVHPVRAELPLQLPPHFFHKPRSHAVRRRLNMQPQRSRPRRLGLRRRDRAVFEHRVDHGIPAAHRPVGILQRRKLRRPLGQPGQQRGLRQRQFGRML